MITKLHQKQTYMITIFFFTMLCGGMLFASPSAISENQDMVPYSADPKLTIYTYDSLLADPGYDFIEGFANYSEITVDEIQLVKFSDANTILSEVVLEKESPVADVIIGLDNVLVHKAKEHNVLEVYESPVLTNISEDLISNLDPDHFLHPYDYGIIALYYKSENFNQSTLDILETLTLEQIISENLAAQLIVENPTLSSPGLGFLLWTIATYGDDQLDIPGILEGDWRDWWQSTKDDLRITSSWGEAWVEWADASQERPLMVSYGSSPAYSAVLYNDTTESAIVSHENNTQNAWLQIEGIGLVKDAPHPDVAQDFIDWFLSPELQENIPTNNWMYPANTEIEIDPIFQANSIEPSSVTLLNNLITPTQIGDHLEQWQDDWEAIIAGTYEEKSSIPGYPFLFTGTLVMGTIYIILAKRYNKTTR